MAGSRPKRITRTNKKTDFEYDDYSTICECEVCARIGELPEDIDIDFTTVTVDEGGNNCLKRVPCDIKTKVNPASTIQALEQYLAQSEDPGNWGKAGDHGTKVQTSGVTITVYNNGTMMVQMNHKCVEWGLNIWPQVQHIITNQELPEDSEILNSDTVTPSGDAVCQMIDDTDQSTRVKQVYADETNPLMITPRHQSSYQPESTPLRGTVSRSAYKLAESTHKRVDVFESVLAKLAEEFLEHSLKVERSLQTIHSNLDVETKKKDEKIHNLRQEVDNLQTNRKKLLEENTLLSEQLKNQEIQSAKLLQSANQNADTTPSPPSTPQPHITSPPTTTNLESIYIKGNDHILSMMYNSTIRYRGVMYMTPEHAYQSTKMEYSGVEKDMLDSVKTAADGYAAKKEAKKCPYSVTWQDKKSKELENICRSRADQDLDFRTILKATDEQPLIHNVHSEYWGTGKSGKGKNIYGRILERVRKSLKDPEQDNSEETPLPEDREHLVVRKDATVLLLTDSVLKHVDPKRFRGKRVVHKQRVTNSEELLSVTRSLDASHKITEVVVHVGINDVTSGQSQSSICQNIEHSIVALKEKLKSTIVVSGLVSNSTQDKTTISNINRDMEQICSKRGCTFVPHNLKQHMFQDQVHVNLEGTTTMVTDITRHLRPTTKQNNRSYTGRQPTRLFVRPPYRPPARPSVRPPTRQEKYSAEKSYYNYNNYKSSEPESYNDNTYHGNEHYENNNRYNDYYNDYYQYNNDNYNRYE